MLNVYHSSASFFYCFFFFLSTYASTSETVSVEQYISLQCSLPDVVISTDAILSHWAFYFEGFGLPLALSGSWSDSICKVHIAL